MSKILSFGKEAFEKVLKGFDITADALTGTIGPRGRNVMINDPMQVNITNDGHQIASHISFADEYEDVGRWLITNTSAKTNDDVGDGTTTTAVLLQEIVHESLKRPENPMVIKNSLQEASKKITEQIKESSKEITLDDIKNVALTSAESEEIANLVCDTIKEVGVDGSIIVEESRTFETSREIVNGYEVNVGYISPYFVNDETNTKAIFENVAVLVAEKKIATVQDIVPLFNQMAEQKIGQIVIVCNEIDPSILGILVGSKISGKVNSCVIKATGYALEDIAATVGATIISDINGINFNTIDIAKHLGTAEKIICDHKKTVFIANAPEGKAHADRLRKLAETISNQFDKANILKRVNQLTVKVGTILIGASTDTERSYKKDKADDTVAAVKAALKEGIVEGGGMCLWRISQTLDDNNIGESILKKALTSPLRKICENAGKDYTEIVSNLPKNKGYDASKDTYSDLIKEGIIDPTRVTRIALENAVSTASIFITTHCVVVNEKEKICK